MLYRVVGLAFLVWGASAACSALVAAPLSEGPPPAGEAVSLYLRPVVTLHGPVVTVGDVAAMEGGASAYRQWLAALDLADLSPTAPDLEITKEQVAFRLRLAGAGANQFQLLGAKTLGVSSDYHEAKMPPVGTGLLDGQLAWRQHDGGHTDAPNVKYFITWADRFMGRTQHAP